MTEEQAEELFNIAYQMAHDPYTDINTYKEMLEVGDVADLGEQNRYDTINLDGFKKINDRYADIRDLEDYVGFIDRMNNFKNNALLSSILESDQIAELYTLGTFAELTEQQIDEAIAMTYGHSGKTGDSLYETVLEAIDIYDPKEPGIFK